MAISFAQKTNTSPIAVEDFIEALRKAYQGHAIDAMQEVAGKLQSLAENREFIRDALIAELKRIARQQNLVSFAPQSFIIHRDFAVFAPAESMATPCGKRSKD
ncbi:MAG: hypothetical protein WDM89_10895 [Rhizomicrobium sp.]